MESAGWQKAHDDLRNSMQKEISIMREILANLHQEELSLLMHDKNSWTQVMEERSKMIESLSSFRSARMQATQKLQDGHQEEKSEISLEKLLPIEDEKSCEILSLRDQLMALTERMNSQNSRNQNLFQKVEKNFDSPPDRLQPLPRSAPQKPKRKPSVATYD